MKKTLLLLAFLFTAALCTYAQDDAQVKFGVGITAGGTIGPASGEYPIAGGVKLRIEYPFSDNDLSLLVTTGYTYFVSSDGYSINYNSDGNSYSYGKLASFIPVQAGLKAYVFNKLYVQGDVGASFNVNSNYQDYTQKKVALLVTPSVGYTIPFGRSRWSLDAGLGYENRIEPGGGYSQINVHAIFNVGL